MIGSPQVVSGLDDDAMRPSMRHTTTVVDRLLTRLR